MKKNIIFITLNILIISSVVFGQDSYVKYCKAEIFLTEQILAEDIASLEIAPDTQIESLDDPARVIVEITQADAQVLIDSGVDVNILSRYVLYSTQTEISPQATTDIGVSPALLSTTAWYSTKQYTNIDFPIPNIQNTLVCCPIDMSGFGDALVYKIDVHFEFYHQHTDAVTGFIKNQGGSIEHTLFKNKPNYYGADILGIETFIREPIAQNWYFCIRVDYGNCGTGYIIKWSIRFNYGPPENNDCSSAKVITKGTEYTGLTDFATGSGSSECVNADGNDVWFKYTPTETGMATITTQGSSFDTTLTVYNGCGGGELACNDDAFGTYSEISMYMEQGNTYYIRLAGYHLHVGDYVLKLDQIACVMPSPATNPVPSSGQERVLVDDLTLAWNINLTASQSTDVGEAGVEEVEITADVDSQKTIYGIDNRKDNYQVTDINRRANMLPVAAIFDKADWGDNQDGTFSLSQSHIETLNEWYLRTNPLGTRHNLCSSEPFIDQLNPALGTAFLVANDIIATSTQCLQSLELENIAFVFGFVMQDASTPVTTVASSKIYYADEIIAFQAGVPDWALIKLDRPVTGYVPLSIRRDGKISDSQQLYTVGYPLGLPKKLTDGGVVKDNTSVSFFRANLDSYERSSGSPVFNANTWVVEGIMTHDSNSVDFEQGSSCDYYHDCLDGGCNDSDAPKWEIVTRSKEFASLVPLPPDLYDIYLDTHNPPQNLIWPNKGTNTVQPGLVFNVQPYVKYYWRVVSKNECGEVPSSVWSFTTTAFEADYNNDRIVDNEDLALIASNWLEYDGECNLAGDATNIINFEDFSILVSDWLKTSP